MLLAQRPGSTAEVSSVRSGPSVPMLVSSTLLVGRGHNTRDRTGRLTFLSPSGTASHAAARAAGPPSRNSFWPNGYWYRYQGPAVLALAPSFPSYYYRTLAIVILCSGAWGGAHGNG